MHRARHLVRRRGRLPPTRPGERRRWRIHRACCGSRRVCGCRCDYHLFGKHWICSAQNGGEQVAPSRTGVPAEWASGPVQESALMRIATACPTWMTTEKPCGSSVVSGKARNKLEMAPANELTSKRDIYGLCRRHTHNLRWAPWLLTQIPSCCVRPCHSPCPPIHRNPTAPIPCASSPTPSPRWRSQTSPSRFATAPPPRS